MRRLSGHGISKSWGSPGSLTWRCARRSRLGGDPNGLARMIRRRGTEGVREVTALNWRRDCELRRGPVHVGVDRRASARARPPRNAGESDRVGAGPCASTDSGDRSDARAASCNPWWGRALQRLDDPPLVQITAENRTPSGHLAYPMRPRLWEMGHGDRAVRFCCRQTVASRGTEGTGRRSLSRSVASAAYPPPVTRENPREMSRQFLAR